MCGGASELSREGWGLWTGGRGLLMKEGAGVL